MTPNVSIWIRAFRPPLQRAFSRPDEADRDLADLLRRIDERKTDPCTDETGKNRPRK